MKKNLLVFASLILLSLSAIAQNTVNLIIFSEDGDPFYAYINGVKQNNVAETNVKFTNLSPNISLRIEFENKTLPQLKQTMALEAGLEHTARIKRDMKKQLKLRYFGSVPLNEAAAGMTTVQYHTAEDTNTINSSDNSIFNNSGNTTTSSTTITQSGNTTPANVSVNINMPGVTMNVNAVDPNATMNTTSSTTLTQSSSSGITYAKPQDDPYGNGNSSHYSSDCRTAMSPASFLKMKESVEAKPFSDTKMSTAKVATQNACLSVNQIKTIAKLFSMDDDKLAYAKFAYDHCIDKANYYQVSDVFNSSFTTDELNAFLQH